MREFTSKNKSPRREGRGRQPEGLRATCIAEWLLERERVKHRVLEDGHVLGAIHGRGGERNSHLVCLTVHIPDALGIGKSEGVRVRR